MMVKVLIYGYATGVFSSRKLARKLHEDVAFQCWARDQYPQTAAMNAKPQTSQGKAAYRKRKWIAEPPNGWIKNVLGFRQFSMRGAAPRASGVQAFKLVCLALNLRRMCAPRAA